MKRKIHLANAVRTGLKATNTNGEAFEPQRGDPSDITGFFSRENLNFFFSLTALFRVSQLAVISIDCFSNGK